MKFRGSICQNGEPSRYILSISRLWVLIYVIQLLYTCFQMVLECLKNPNWFWSSVFRFGKPIRVSLYPRYLFGEYVYLIQLSTSHSKRCTKYICHTNGSKAISMLVVWYFWSQHEYCFYLPACFSKVSGSFFEKCTSPLIISMPSSRSPSNTTPAP